MPCLCYAILTTPSYALGSSTRDCVQVSKSELKRRQKQRQREEEKAKKAAAAPPKAASKKKEDEEELDPRMYYENRSKAIKALLDSNSPNPYPHKFHVTYDDKQFVKDYEHIKVRLNTPYSSSVDS